jgi:ATP-dependent helicase/nuclease subunit A
MITLHIEQGKLVLGYPRLSDAQRAALTCDEEVAVSAGAGAGKTSTLAARYVALFERLIATQPAPDIADVLVLTFTEKAAQEMRERCYAATAAVARALRTDADRLVAAGLPRTECLRLRARWESLRDRFAGAAISTFHGFCARILREFPAETGTPPGFAILEESDAAALLDEAASAAVDEALSRGGDGVHLLLESFSGRGGVVDAVRELLQARGEVAETLEAHAAGRVDASALLGDVDLASIDAFLTGEWRDLSRRLLSVTEGVETSFLAEVADTVTAVDDLPADPLVRCELYGRALDLYTSSSGGVRSLAHHSATGVKAAWPDAARHKAARPALAALQEEAQAWAARIEVRSSLPNRHDRTLDQVLAALSVVVLDARERLAASLRDARAVDFTELQLRVKAAFASNGPVAGELRRRHRFIMVDEFQDTDSLQWSIVESLARPTGAPEDRLFFVGDVKQAIYGFRGGDVQVFNAARRTIARPVELATNYRSRPELITFFNQLFADVLGPDHAERPAWEAPFAALAPGRTGTPAGTVRVASYTGRGDARREAIWIASLLADEILPEKGAFSGLGLGDLATHPTPPVALLLQTRTHLPSYEDALRARGIPYVVVGGVGFWSRPEVVDVANILHGLVRGDTLSLVAALRSPGFGLTDQDLLDLRDAGLLHRFADVKIIEPLPGRERILAAQADWCALRALKDRVSASELIYAILVRLRQAWVQGDAAPGGRGAANLERLLSLADRHEQAGGSLDRLVERLHQKVEEDARESEAAVPDTTARVALLTVHQSKGLEYPVVILPDLGRGRLPDRSAIVRRRVGDRWEIACKVPDLHGDIAQLATPGRLGRLRAHGRELESAESKRLFYVACTRARDHLVLVGARSESDKPIDEAARWSDLLAAHGQTLREKPDWLVWDELPEAEEVNEAPPPAPPLAPPPEDLPLRLAPIAGEHHVQVSPSSLARFNEDPDAWFQRHVLRVPEIDAAHRADARGAGAGASTRGSVLHGLLEDNLLDDLDAARARWNAAAYADGLDAEAVERGWPALAEQLATLAGSPDVAAVLAAQGYAELPVRLVHGNVTLDGRIDRLCRDPEDGSWMVVDYKSVRADGDLDALLDAHRAQLLAYSAAASHVLERQQQGPVRRAALLLTRTGRLHRLPDWTEEDFRSLDVQLERLAARVASG